VLASTDFDPRQAERRTITDISGNTITLDKKLDYMHFGKITFDVDERGQEGLLTHRGDEALRMELHHEEPPEILWFAKTSVASLLPRPGSISGDRCGLEGMRCH
jgi:hypothetical protein